MGQTDSPLPGYHGRYLRIDVESGQCEAVPLPEEVLRRYVGGVGLGTWIATQEGGAEHDPLAPEAPLVFCFSPLVGTPLTTSAKLAVVGRSPLTTLLTDALSSSHFAIHGKRTGHDALVLVGRAPAWVRVVVDEEGVELRGADELLGRAAADCELDGHRTAAIGPAGERGVLYATLSNDGRHAGRGGLGAVMGAKRVKALSVRGQRRVRLHDAEGVLAAARSLSERSLGPATAKYRELGTIENLLSFNRLNALPVRNFAAGAEAHVDELSAEALHASARVGNQTCAACGIGCEHLFRGRDGAPVRLEYESLYALGPLLGVESRDEVLAAAALCDSLGVDTISAGGTLAYAMEAGGYGVEFGDGASVLRALERIASGDEPSLARGSRAAAEERGRPELAMHVKGLELPGYDPRRLRAMALGFAVGSRGADHNRSSAYELDFSTETFSVERVIALEDRAAAMDSLILCKFLRGVFADFEREAGELLQLVTGASIDLARSGAAIVELKKRFNERAGWQPALDALPARLHDDGWPAAELADTIRAYYAARGWTDEGWVRCKTERTQRPTAPSASRNELPSS